MIRCPMWTRFRSLFPPGPPLRDALQSSPTHQARHAVTATPRSGIPQIFSDVRTADDAVRLSMKVMNAGE
jgi:hypothetical protein